MDLQPRCEHAAARAGQRLLGGEAGLAEAASLVSDGGRRRWGLVTGERWLETSGWLARLLALWGARPTVVLRVPSNPGAGDAEALAERATAAGVEALFAVGGGSALDVSKLVSARGSGPTLLAVAPTTAGTGTEVTPYASVIDADGIKRSVEDARMVPAVVVHAPALLLEQPLALAARTAADALTQAIESLWSRRATEQSRADAEAALGALITHGVESCRRPTPVGKAVAQCAALLSGAAIATSRTTAVHSVSYPLTARFGIPHGRALAALLPSFMRYNEAYLADDVRARIARACGESSYGAAVDGVEDWLTALGLPTRFAQLGLGPGALELVIAEGYREERMAQSPRVPEPSELGALLGA